MMIEEKEIMDKNGQNLELTYGCSVSGSHSTWLTLYMFCTVLYKPSQIDPLGP